VALRPEGQDDPLLSWAPGTFCAYQWHSYVGVPPEGSVLLAESPVCAQAYRIGERAWGVQFHPEVTREILEGWADDLRSDEDAVRLGVDPDAAREQWEPRLPEWNAFGRRLFAAFLAAAGLRS
jgi:GMP synthase (glutamine-hydrolysing)